MGSILEALILTQRLSPPIDRSIPIHQVLPLTAFERTRTRHRLETETGKVLYLRLPRGLVLRDGDVLCPDAPNYYVQVLAKPEPVLTVTAATGFDLLRAAYHLGNRHIPLEITPHALRLSPDPVLQNLLEQLGVQVTAEVAPFNPETGAYESSHSHSHDHS